jgi:hypothetical protein
MNFKKLLKKAARWFWKEHKDDVANVVIKEAEKVKTKR